MVKPAITEKKATLSRVEDAIRDVADPCTAHSKEPLDVLSMGLIGGIEVKDGTARMKLLLCDPTCIFGDQIRQAVTASVMRVEGVERVEIGFDTEEIWTPRKLSPEAAERFWPQRRRQADGEAGRRRA